MEEVDRKQVTSMREYLAETKESTEVFRWIFKVMITPESKRKLKMMFAAMATAIFLQAMFPYAVSYIFDGLTAKHGNAVIWGLVAVLGCLIAQRVMDRIQESAREAVFALHWMQFDDRITEMFFEKSIGQHIQESKTLSVSNIDKGRWKVLELQSLLLFDAIPTIVQIFVSYILLCFLSGVAGLVMGIVMVIYIVWSLFLNARVAVECHPIDKDFRALNRRRTERWDRVERVKVNGKEVIETQEMSVIFADVMRRDLNFWLWFIKVASVRSVINVVGLVSVISWGAWLVWKGQWNIGLLYPLFAWSLRVSENIWRFGQIEHKINWNMPSVKSMIKALDIPPAIIDSHEAVTIDPHVPHMIVFDAVSHTYPAEVKAENSDDLPAALKNVSFTLTPGECVALLGPSGSGKTTVMKKLLRFDDPTSGSISVDGVDLRQIKLASWRQEIGYIPQQAQVFDGTIRYNLTYGLSDEARSKVSDDDLWQLMRLLQIDFGDRLTNGLDTVVGKGGLKLSGGQAQRLMIGAAVIKKPSLLVVDEATSSLDSTTERKVQEGLTQILAQTSTSALIVAHRLSTVRDLCTKFIVLKSATEVSNGDSQVEAIASSFEELYSCSPTFRSLADDQGIKLAL